MVSCHSMPSLFIAFITFLVTPTLDCQRIGGNAERRARARVATWSANSLVGRVIGTVDFLEQNGRIMVTGNVNRLSPGQHGMHIHELGDTNNRCLAAGPHYNPFNRNHGSLIGVQRHIGDLGNINAQRGGMATVNISIPAGTLGGLSIIFGRTLIVHQNPDDLGLGGQPDSLTTGNAGARFACGLIGRVA